MTQQKKEVFKKKFYKKFDADGSGNFCSSEDGDLHSSKGIADWWLSQFDTLLNEKVAEIENKAHFSKLAGSRYDGYMNVQEVITILKQ